MPRLHSTVWLGLGMLGLSIFLAVYMVPTWVIKPDNIQILVLSPDFWPYIISALLAIGGAAMLAQHYFIGHNGVEEEVDDAPAGGGKRIGLVAILMLAYFYVMPFLGMVWGSVVAYVAFMGIIGFPRKKAALIISVVLPLILYAFFNYAAGIPIPQADFLKLP